MWDCLSLYSLHSAKDMGKRIIKIGQHSFHSGCRLSWALIVIMPLPSLCFALDLIAICNNGGVWSSHVVWSANDALFLINLSPPLLFIYYCSPHPSATHLMGGPQHKLGIFLSSIAPWRAGQDKEREIERPTTTTHPPKHTYIHT